MRLCTRNPNKDFSIFVTHPQWRILCELRYRGQIQRQFNKNHSCAFIFFCSERRRQHIPCIQPTKRIAHLIFVSQPTHATLFVGFHFIVPGSSESSSIIIPNTSSSSSTTMNSTTSTLRAVPRTINPQSQVWMRSVPQSSTASSNLHSSRTAKSVVGPWI